MLDLYIDNLFLARHIQRMRNKLMFSSSSVFTARKKCFCKVLFYPLSVCLSVCLFVCLFVCLSVCPEDISGTAWRNETNFSMCTHDHHPLILQRDEGQGHKVKVTKSRKLIFGEGVCERALFKNKSETI